MLKIKPYLPTIRDYLLIGISSIIQAFSLRIFFVPANLASAMTNTAFARTNSTFALAIAALRQEKMT